MAAKKQETHAKRARELAVKERRERKRAKRAEAAAQRAATGAHAADSGSGGPGEGYAETATAEWIR
jgi:hypothetical protein